MLETYRQAFADFLQKPSLCRRAGCSEDKLALVASKELIDNALDASPDHVAVEFAGDDLIVTDAGPGLSESQVLSIFSVRRESLSSKRWRRADRGALAVVAFIETSLVGHGVGKIVPPDEVLAAHFQKAAFDLRLDQAIAPLRAEINARCQDVAAQMRAGAGLDVEVPPLRELVRRHLARHPQETWREAVAAAARESELDGEAA